jgi:hypothetical protein
MHFAPIWSPVPRRPHPRRETPGPGTMRADALLADEDRARHLLDRRPGAGAGRAVDRGAQLHGAQLDARRHAGRRRRAVLSLELRAAGRRGAGAGLAHRRGRRDAVRAVEPVLRSGIDPGVAAVDLRRGGVRAKVAAAAAAGRAARRGGARRHAAVPARHAAVGAAGERGALRCDRRDGGATGAGERRCGGEAGREEAGREEAGREEAGPRRSPRPRRRRPRRSPRPRRSSLPRVRSAGKARAPGRGRRAAASGRRRGAPTRRCTPPRG